MSLGRTFGVVVALGVSVACGKKGPPLAPLIPIPAPVQLIEATRVGSDVFVSVTIPAANVDEFTPADLDRVDVYGYTGHSAPPRARWVELGTLVGTVPVAPPPPKPGEKPKSERATAKPAKGPQPPLQGSKVFVLDSLTQDELVQGREAPTVRAPQLEASRTADSESRTADRGSRPAEPLRRFYTALPFNTRGRPGPPGGVAEFALLPVPDPPPSVGLWYTERATVVSWEPSGGLIGFLLERALPSELPPFVEDDTHETPEPSEPSGPVSYNVYRDILPDPMAPPPEPGTNWREQPPAPITSTPVPTLDFTDNVEFGRRRCYTVRAVRGIGPEARVGDASPPACVTPIDIFPPAPPQSLAAVASEGVISLIWEPNVELDLGGYVVLRGEPPGDTLQPLTAGPVAAARYKDETVKPGVRYMYAVIAVDNRFPVPNMSAESVRVEETAR